MCVTQMREWLEMLSRCVHNSFEGNVPFHEDYVFSEWKYSPEQKRKCRDDLAWFMTERDHPDTDLYWTVFRHRLEKKRYKSTTKALQETLQEAWKADVNEWLRLM